MASLASRVMQGQKVTRETQAPQVPEEKMVRRDQRGRRDWPVRKAPQGPLEKRASLGCPVSQATQDAQDLRDRLDFLGPWDLWERRANGAKRDSQGRKERGEHQVPVETEASQGLQANLARRVKWARTGLLGSQEKRVFLVCRAPQDSLDQRAPQVPREKMGSLDTLGKEENWASKVRPARPDQLVCWVPRER